MKEYKPTYIDVKQKPADLILGVNEELVEKWIYARYKVISQSITATGDYHIKNWFPPRLVEINVQETDKKSDWKTDFTTTFSIRSSWNGSAFITAETSNLISLWNLTGNATIRYNDWFNLNISAFSWSAKTIYITCYS